jgi:hypothetical protein
LIKSYEVPLDPENSEALSGPLTQRIWDEITGIQVSLASTESDGLYDDFRLEKFHIRGPLSYNEGRLILIMERTI